MIGLIWRYGWLNDPAIWLTDKILANISRTKIFPNLVLCRNTTNITFHYRINPVITSEKTFHLIKKQFLAHFWCIFPILLAKFFSWKIWLSHTTSYQFLASCKHFEKTNDTIPRKCPGRWKDGRMEGWKDWQTQFYRTYPAIAGSPKSLKGQNNIN